MANRGKKPRKKSEKKHQRGHAYKRGASHSREPNLWKPGDPLTEADLQLLSEIWIVYRQLDYVPSQKEVPGAKAIKKRFRTWGEAIAAAGLPRYNDAGQVYQRQKKQQEVKESEEEV